VPYERTLISSGSSFEQEIGYSRAVVQGDWVFLSGTTGFDYSTMTSLMEFKRQTEQCLKNIEAALLQAGSSPKTWFACLRAPGPERISRVLAVLRKYFGEVRPAAMMISRTCWIRGCASKSKSRP